MTDSAGAVLFTHTTVLASEYKGYDTGKYNRNPATDAANQATSAGRDGSANTRLNSLKY